MGCAVVHAMTGRETALRAMALLRRSGSGALTEGTSDSAAQDT